MITYEVIVAATMGEPVAVQQVLEHFEKYIDHLCSHTFIDEGGYVTYGVDTIRKTQLQGKLIAAMLHFKP